ncbi:hypothetical protein EYR40_002086 [Pleurotus pulmonarius]|nr:hypothetical protein EYR40_002086 [Pleurotus pulmonarius]
MGFFNKASNFTVNGTTMNDEIPPIITMEVGRSTRLMEFRMYTFPRRLRKLGKGGPGKREQPGLLDWLQGQPI